MVRDIEKVGDIFVLAIRLDYRDADASLKTEDSDITAEISSEC